MVYMRNQRAQNGVELNYPVEQQPNGKNTSAVNNFINYENDNIFETDDDRLMLIKKIQDHTHFWERIESAFFNNNISKELLINLEKFYLSKADLVAHVIQDVQSQLKSLGDNFDNL